MDAKELNFKEYLENKRKMDEELQMQQLRCRMPDDPARRSRGSLLPMYP